MLAGGALLGLGLGCEVGLNAYLVSRYFGLKAFGSIYGLTFAASNLGIGTGVFLMGWLSEATGSYDIIVWSDDGAVGAVHRLPGSVPLQRPQTLTWSVP